MLCNMKRVIRRLLSIRLRTVVILFIVIGLIHLYRLSLDDDTPVYKYFEARRNAAFARPELAKLAQATIPHSHDAKIGVVIASQAEDLKWVLDYCHERDAVPFIYSMNTFPTAGQLVPATRRGREAAAYLSYVVTYYDSLPEYSLFVHSSPAQRHNDLFGPLTITALRNLRLDSVAAHGYVNLRCDLNPGCPTGVFPLNPSEADIKNRDIRYYFSDIYQELFNVPKEAVPAEIGNVCCAQFAVSRERIRARPKEDYERILNWMATTKITDSFGIGWVMEKLWHIIFGMDARHCPNYEQCRCDLYGWCGPLFSGDTLQPVTKATH